MTLPRFVPTAFRWALLGASTVLLLAACTEDVTPPEALVSSSPGDPSQGGLLVIVAPGGETSAEAYELETSYHVLIDGVELTDQTYGPIWVNPGITVNAGFHDAGGHHIELTATASPTVFAVDIVITGGALNRLYVFGPRGGLKARFDAYPLAPPSGEYHLTAINLVRAGGVQIEVVSCADAATCTPVSPPLSLGDTFDTDISNVPFRTDSTGGAGFGYRQVATASLPTAPVISFSPAVFIGPDPQGITAYIAAPIYMSSDGNMILAAN
jgi:hypothetical protein